MLIRYDSEMLLTVWTTCRTDDGVPNPTVSNVVENAEEQNRDVSKQCIESKRELKI